jgi:ribosomal protein L37AE/L43A
MSRKINQLTGIENKEKMPDGRFRVKSIYKGKIINRYYVEVICSHCQEEKVIREAQNLKKQKYTFCDKCKHLRAKFYYTLDVKVKTSGHILKYQPEHPNAKKNYVPEHRLVVENSIGRLLEKNEVVHHIDCVKDNNSIENLFLTTPAGHNKAHNSLNDCVKHLLHNKHIYFDKSEGTYKIVK